MFPFLKYNTCYILYIVYISIYICFSSVVFCCCYKIDFLIVKNVNCLFVSFIIVYVMFIIHLILSDLFDFGFTLGCTAYGIILGVAAAQHAQETAKGEYSSSMTMKYTLVESLTQSFSILYINGRRQ